MRKNRFLREHKNFVIVSIVFLIFVILGACLNKFDLEYIKNSSEKLEQILSYYSGNISISEIVVANLKEDIKYLILLTLFSLFFFSYFIAIIVFAVKALSIGYTINTCILLLKFNAFKLCLIVFIKNLIIIPASIVLVVLSTEYIKKLFKQLKKKGQDSILFLGKRYLYYAIIIIILSIILQLLLNIISISILKFLLR